jgi:hypothetical protein
MWHVRVRRDFMCVTWTVADEPTPSAVWPCLALRDTNQGYDYLL